MTPEQRKYLIQIIGFSIAIAVLVQPSVLHIVMGLTPKQVYPTNTIVITHPLVASDTDIQYCYPKVHDFNVSIVFFLEPTGSPTWVLGISQQYLKANISLSFSFYWVNESTQQENRYYDFEFEHEMLNYKGNNHFVWVFAHLSPNKDVYPNIAGYSRLDKHLAISLTLMLHTQTDYSNILLHESLHTMGLLAHATDPHDIFYSMYTGQSILMTSTIDRLYRFHYFGTDPNI